MNTITIKNLSTLKDFSAVARTASFMAGFEYDATHDSTGEERVRIIRKGNVYTICDKEE